MLTVKIKYLYPDSIKATRGHPTDSGLDLPAYLPNGDLTIPRGEGRLVSTGIAVRLPNAHTFKVTSEDGWWQDHVTYYYEGNIRGRSGLTVKSSQICHWGTLDNPYTGEIKVFLFNFTNADFTVKHGIKVAQFVVNPIAIPSYEEVDDLGETDRGDKGFGSTGI